MLFIQSLDTYYHKQERSSEFARLRTGDEFRKIDCSQIKECEVFAQLLRFGYGDDGRAVPAQLYSETYKAYGKNIFTEGTRDRYDNYNRLLKFIRIFKVEDGILYHSSNLFSVYSSKIFTCMRIYAQCLC